MEALTCSECGVTLFGQRLAAKLVTHSGDALYLCNAHRMSVPIVSLTEATEVKPEVVTLCTLAGHPTHAFRLGAIEEELPRVYGLLKGL